jgi:sporulation protein YlmC with PRC-barrel domain
MNQATKNQVTEFVIGADVVGSDGVLGQLTRVVVDPIARTIARLVVEPPHRRGPGRLVPVELVASALEGEIRVRCNASDFSSLAEADETHFIPGANGAWGYQQSQMLTLPYYALCRGIGMGRYAGPHAVTSDRVPAGDVEVRRGEHVHATDGTIGRVQGLVVNPSDHAVTHILLEEGHLWGKKRVAIPIAAVIGVEDGVRLRVTKQEIEGLPPVSVDDPN